MKVPEGGVGERCVDLIERVKIVDGVGLEVHHNQSPVAFAEVKGDEEMSKAKNVAAQYPASPAFDMVIVITSAEGDGSVPGIQ